MRDISEITLRYGPEMALAVLIGRAHFGTAKAAELAGYISNHRIDWRLFEKIIKAHHIRPLAYKVLAPVENIDPTFLNRLRNKCMKLTAASMQQLAELRKIADVYIAAGIRHIPYKGVILSQMLFGDTISREAVDIDLMIEPASFPAANDLLLRMGYTSQYYKPEFEKQFLRTSHELQFSKDTLAGQLKVEIHWKITSRMMAVRQDMEILFRETQQISLAGYETGAFSPSATLLILLIHHGVNDVWRSQKHIIDIAAFLAVYSSVVDWQPFERLAGRTRIRHTTQVGFALAHLLYGVEVPQAFRLENALSANIIDDLLQFPAITKGKLKRENISRQLFLRDSLADKVRLLTSYFQMALTPNIRDVEALPLPKSLYWLYYVVKPFRMLLRRGKK